jgi:hypothetical protein
VAKFNPKVSQSKSCNVSDHSRKMKFFAIFAILAVGAAPVRFVIFDSL